MTDSALCAAKSREFRPVFDELGATRFANTVTRCIREHGAFFPSVGEFSAYAAEEKTTGRAFQGCGQCSDGWVMVNCMENGSPVKRAKRCECWNRVYRGGAQ